MSADTPLEQSFWLRGLSPVEDSDIEDGEPWDAVIVGAGYAGLGCSIELARSGLRVLVLEANLIGEGASSKAAGSLANLPKAKLADLSRLYDLDTGERIYREYAEAREFTEALIEQNRIDCDLIKSKRVLAAHTERSFRRIRADAETIKTRLSDLRVLSRDELRSFIGSSAYYGGLLVPDCATVNPAKLQFGMARIATSLGVKILQRSRVHEIRELSTGDFSVSTVSGRKATAINVVIATNAETAANDVPLLRELGKLIAPVPSFVVVTEPLTSSLIEQVLSNAGIFGDTCKVLNYFAISPCGTRLVLSARAGFLEGTPLYKAERILADMVERFPCLHGTRIAYYWNGSFAITEDLIPHVGHRNRIHGVLGCCGTGITMSNYLGFKAARKILGGDDADTVFQLPIPLMSAWKRNPYMLGTGIRLYRALDRFIN